MKVMEQRDDLEPAGTLLGDSYRVARRTDDDPFVEYELFGKRDAHYGLKPSRNNPDIFFVVNLRPGCFGFVTTVKGNSWIRRKDDGTLAAVS